MQLANATPRDHMQLAERHTDRDRDRDRDRERDSETPPPHLPRRARARAAFVGVGVPGRWVRTCARACVRACGCVCVRVPAERWVPRLAASRAARSSSLGKESHRFITCAGVDGRVHHTRLPQLKSINVLPPCQSPLSESRLRPCLSHRRALAWVTAGIACPSH